MPNQRIAQTFLVLGKVPHRKNQNQIAFINSGYQQFVDLFEPYDDAIGTLDEKNVFFQCWSPVPGDDPTDPNNLGVSGEPRPEAQKILNVITKHLDTLAKSAVEFQELYQKSTEGVFEPPPVAEALAAHWDVDATAADNGNEAKTAYRHIKDALQKGSLIRPLLQFEVLCQALEVAADFWVNHRGELNGGDSKPEGADAKPAWDRASFDTLSLADKVRWLYTLLTRSNHMPKGSEPKLNDGERISWQEFQKEIERYGKSFEVKSENDEVFDKWVVPIPLAHIPPVLFDIEAEISAALETARQKWQTLNKDPKAQLPSMFEAYIRNFVYACAGVIRIDELYPIDLLRFASMELSDGISGQFEELARRGWADGSAFTSDQGNRVTQQKLQTKLNLQISEQQEACLTDPSRIKRQRLANRSAADLLSKIDEPQRLRATVRRRWVALGDNTTVRTKLTDELYNRELLIGANEGAKALQKFLPKRDTVALPTPAESPAESQTLVSPKSTAELLVTEFKDADPGDNASIDSILKDKDPIIALPARTLAEWTATGVKMALKNASFLPPDIIPTVTEETVKTKEATICSALRMLYLGSIMLHEGVDFAKDKSAKALTLLTESIRYGSIREMLKSVRLDMFVDFNSAEDLFQAHQDAEKRYQSEKTRCVHRLSFCYGLRELLRSTATKKNRVGIYLEGKTAFEQLYIADPSFDPAQFNQPATNIPATMYVHRTALDGTTWPTSGMLSVQGIVRPLPPTILDSNPVSGNTLLSATMDTNPAIPNSYLFYAGPGLRARGKCDGSEKVPFVPAGFLVIAALAEGTSLGYNCYPSLNDRGDTVRFLFVPRGAKQIGKDWIEWAKELLAWDTKIYFPIPITLS